MVSGEKHFPSPTSRMLTLDVIVGKWLTLHTSHWTFAVVDTVSPVKSNAPNEGLEPSTLRLKV